MSHLSLGDDTCYEAGGYEGTSLREPCHVCLRTVPCRGLWLGDLGSQRLLLDISRASIQHLPVIINSLNSFLSVRRPLTVEFVLTLVSKVTGMEKLHPIMRFSHIHLLRPLTLSPMPGPR